jgi:F0F1-type ATP synthase membrane subunit b/b'
VNGDEFIEKAMQQARELQARIAQALDESDKLRATLMENARSTADETNEQTKAAIDNLEAAMRSGSEFLQRFLRKT